MPIKTGRYFIINAQHRNHVFLPNSNSEESVESRYEQNDLGEQWNVIDRRNGHHGIKNVRYDSQFLASGDRAGVGAVVHGWEREQTWLIQKTSQKGKYTISTTDSRRFWGVVDNQQGTPVALAEAHTNPRNWWTFVDVETRKDAEVNPELDNGRTADDTANSMILQNILFERALPSAPPASELNILVIRELPKLFDRHITDTVKEICDPLIESRKFSPSNIRVNFIEFECIDEEDSRQRSSEVRTFEEMQDYDYGDNNQWISCSESTAGVITASLIQGLSCLRRLATKVVVLDLRAIPIQSGGPDLLKLLRALKDRNVTLILTLDQPHVTDTLFDTALFQEVTNSSSGPFLSLPADGLYASIVDYVQHSDVESIKRKFPGVQTVDPKPFLRQRDLNAHGSRDRGYHQETNQGGTYQVNKAPDALDMLPFAPDSHGNDGAGNDQDDDSDAEGLLDMFERGLNRVQAALEASGGDSDSDSDSD